MTKKTLFTSMLIVLITSLSFAQKTESIEKIKLGTGYTIVDYSYLYGRELAYNIGYSKSISNNHRLWLVPSLTVGDFTNENIDDAEDQHFLTSILSVALQYDIISRNRFKFNVTAGSFISYLKNFKKNYSNLKTYDYGYNFSLGMEFKRKDKPYSIEFRPINVNLGANSFVQFGANAIVNYRL